MDDSVVHMYCNLESASAVHVNGSLTIAPFDASGTTHDRVDALSYCMSLELYMYCMEQPSVEGSGGEWRAEMYCRGSLYVQRTTTSLIAQPLELNVVCFIQGTESQSTNYSLSLLYQ